MKYKTAYSPIVIGKELGGGGETQVILRIGSLGYTIECRKRLRANYLNRVKPTFNKLRSRPFSVCRTLLRKHHLP